MKTIAFFNNKGGVGKTSLVYHLTWMYAELGFNIVATDLDPQANLTTMFLEEDRLEELWPDDQHPDTLRGMIDPILEGTGDIVVEPHLEPITENVGLVVGDLGLSLFEDKLSEAWPRCLDKKQDAVRVISAFYRILLNVSQRQRADMVLIDVGPNLGAINRAALIAADYLVIPLAPDLFSLQGLKNLGPRLRTWQSEWKDRFERNQELSKRLPLPEGQMQALGYVILQHSVRSDRPVKAYERWMERMPQIYRKFVKNEDPQIWPSVQEDPECLSTLKNYRSLMPMAMEAHKPMFLLKPADGAMGVHTQAVKGCYKDFEQLARKIANHCEIALES